MDAVAVSDVTSRTLRDRWVFRSLGHPELRGVGSDFEVLMVVGHDPVPGPDVERVYELVDRREPLDELHELWAEVAAGQGQVVVLEGEAGVGKSRLAYELQHGDAARASWLTVQCSPLAREEWFGPLTAYLPALDTSAGLSPEERRATGLGAAARWALGLAESGPAVLHVEDAHWADPSTGELIERLADALASEPRPLFVLCTARPGSRPAVAGPHAGAADRPSPARWTTTCRRSSAPPPKGRLPASTVAEIVQRLPTVWRSTPSSWRPRSSTHPGTWCRRRCRGS